MSKRKYSREFKLKVLKEHQEGASFYSLEKKYDIVLGTVKRWNTAFLAHGEEALDHHNSNLCRYSCSFDRNYYSSESDSPITNIKSSFPPPLYEPPGLITVLLLTIIIECISFPVLSDFTLPSYILNPKN